MTNNYIETFFNQALLLSACAPTSYQTALAALHPGRQLRQFPASVAYSLFPGWPASILPSPLSYVIKLLLQCEILIAIAASKAPSIHYGTREPFLFIGDSLPVRLLPPTPQEF